METSSNGKRAPDELAVAAPGHVVVVKAGGRRTPRRAVQLALFPETVRPATAVKRLLRVPQ
jgi:hypothetical protein